MRKQKRNRYGLWKDERGVWHCDFSVAGERLQLSTYTEDKAAAEEWCAALASRTWREIKLGEKPAIKWEEGVAQWWKDKERDGKRDLANDRSKIVVLEPYLDGHHFHEFGIGEGSALDLNALLDRVQHDRGLENATRNRYRTFIVGVMNHLRGKGYNVPLLKVARRKESPKESRALTREEAALLLSKLPLHLARMGRYSLACGARQANVTGLRWFRSRYLDGVQVPHVSEDLSTMIVPAAYSKSGKMLRLPLNDEAKAVLREARECLIHGSETFVFTYHGRPMQEPANTAFLRVVKECGLDGFTWHGFRHTWTTWHLTATPPTPLEVVQKLGGWSSIHILLKHYAHLLDRHVAQYAGNVMAPAAPSSGVPQLKVVG